MEKQQVTINERKSYALHQKPVGVRSLALARLRLGSKDFGFMRHARSKTSTLGWLYDLSEEALQAMLPDLFLGEGLDRTEWEEVTVRAADGRIAYFAHAKNTDEWSPCPSELYLTNRVVPDNLCGFLHSLRDEAEKGKTSVSFNPGKLADFLEAAWSRSEGESP